MTASVIWRRRLRWWQWTAWLLIVASLAMLGATGDALWVLPAVAVLTVLEVHGWVRRPAPLTAPAGPTDATVDRLPDGDIMICLASPAGIREVRLGHMDASELWHRLGETLQAR